ncbi:hypothetical protein HYPSUDRAFT_221447 [Hypholoma sublateritium FD-334 SS-4]|uniref:Nephrocystin 3-like N-terminal domain-containing protein n=1 Tax=Hypholoma sublateritium (strain FD-334 SS-4) TaxID=945553 RepID=A0A0D2PFL5_HYPSF|nr:hypothetical protein HYPSUDRAFT_221447 [Hypholoma sublateritium FD-334 SS-4]
MPSSSVYPPLVANDSPPQANMFQPGGGMVISGGTFIQQNQTSQALHHCHEADDGFKHLQAHVAPTAYATQQAGDAPKCHPNTRTAVLDDTWNWIILLTTRIHWVLWLYGAAGAGKSAICRSIVEHCLQEHVVIARFFFFRTDPYRNAIHPVVATLVNQLIKQIPDLASLVIPRIQADPLIFKQSFETQFETLIYEPLRQLHLESPFQKAILFLVDGVDECEGDANQGTLISTLIRLLQSNTIPIIVLFASRPENQIKAQFHSPKAYTNTYPLALDAHYLPDEDIRTFLDDSFADIHASHPFKHLIPDEWPAPALVQEIVTKSSGQFIYTGSLTPFAQLDALYHHILSQVQDLDLTMMVLAYVVIGSPSSIIWYIMQGLDLWGGKLSLSLADLSSVVSHGTDLFSSTVEFLHASLPDFLLDPARSGRYHIDRATYSTRILTSWLGVKHTMHPYIENITPFFAYVKPSPELREAYIAFHTRLADPDCVEGVSMEYSSDWVYYLETLHRMVRRGIYIDPSIFCNTKNDITHSGFWRCSKPAGTG